MNQKENIKKSFTVNGLSVKAIWSESIEKWFLDRK